MKLASIAFILISLLSIGAQQERVRILVGSDRPVVLSGAIHVRDIPQIQIQIISVPKDQVENMLKQLRESTRFAEVDRIIAPQLTPNDPYYANQWHLPKISAPSAWDITTGNVTIAICDTGCDPTHPDLRYVPGWNFYDDNSDTHDVYGHGTAVAGAAAAIGNNGIGDASVAWGCSIMPLRVSDINGNAYLSTIAESITWAADHGARVANVSYLVSDSSTVSAAGGYLNSLGGVLTVSSGNYSTFDSTPDDPNMLVVGATDSTDTVTSWSNRGNNLDLVAPGQNVGTTTMNGSYGSGSGTSFSSPIVAGVAALMISINPNLTANQITDILHQSADDLEAAGWDTDSGYGRVNALRAVESACSCEPPPPPSDTIPPVITCPGNRQLQCGSSTDPSATGTAIATDNSGVVTITYLDAPTTGCAASGVSRTWKATDGAGNFSTCIQTISFIDTTPPTFNICPLDQNLGYNPSTIPSCQAITASDNCGSVNMTCAYSDSVNGCSHTRTITYTATDGCGNRAMCVQYVAWIVDVTSPVLSCPSDILLQCGASTTPSNTGTATASDNCSLPVISYSDAFGSIICAGQPNIDRTWRAMDGCGNVSFCIQHITFVSPPPPDTIPPTISITSPLNGSTVNAHGNVNVLVHANDNVSVVSISLYVDGVLKATSTVAPFTTQWNVTKASSGAHGLLCRASDAAGNIGVSPMITVYK